MKKRIQIVIIFFGALSLFLMFVQRLNIRTMIIPSWALALKDCLIVVIISFVIGFVLTKVFKLKLYLLTIPSLLLIIIFAYYKIVEARKNYTIVIPSNYKGEIRLFISKKNNFIINDNGIGYIGQEIFESDRYPTIIQDNKDITEQAKEYNKVKVIPSLKSHRTFEYLSIVMGNAENQNNLRIEELITNGDIDTNQLFEIK